MTFSPLAVIEELKQSSDFEVCHYRHLSSDDAEWGRKITEIGISDTLVTLLREGGINRLFRFQDQAFQRIQARQDTVILAPTGNGKTEAFLLPILSQVDPTEQRVQALLIYPTNALVNDQFRKIEPLSKSLGLRAACFHGGTSQEERQRIFQNPPALLLTNIDIIHANLAKSRAKEHFKQLIRFVRFIVLDEIHTYVGTFGSHAHMILTRLKRILEATPVVISASATLSNASQFVEDFFGPEAELIICQKPRKYSVHVVMVYPNLPFQAAVTAIVRRLNQEQVKTLVFANDHRSSEITVRGLRKEGISAELHRGGLSSSRRRALEEAFREGSIKILVATPTMELGVDIGSLDAIATPIINLTRTLQRIGRAGREGQESLAVVVLRKGDAISEFYYRYPERYFEDRQSLYFEPNNALIIKDQLLAAAADEPLYEREMGDIPFLLEELVAEGLLQRDGTSVRRYFPTVAGDRRLFLFNIRGGARAVEIFDINRNEKIAQRELPMAARELHPGALYSLEGRTYQSQEIDVANGLARVREIQSDQSTTPLYSANAQLSACETKLEIPNLVLEHGPVLVTETVVGYLRRDSDGQKLDQHQIKPIQYTFETEGLSFRFQQALPKERATLLHTLEHLAILSAAQITGGDLREFGGFFGETEGLILYESTPGGNGLTKLLLGRIMPFLQRFQLILEECHHTGQKEDSCPCIFLYYKQNNDLSKSLARTFLNNLLVPLAESMTKLEEDLQPLVGQTRAEILEILNEGPFLLAKQENEVFAHPPMWQVTFSTAQEQALQEFPVDWKQVGTLDKTGLFLPSKVTTTTMDQVTGSASPLLSGKYVAEDGHRVRSRGELLIDNWLYHRGVLHAYERLIQASKDSRMRCDFYIPIVDLYIEYWGLDTPEYLERRQEKEELYRTMGLTLLSVENTDIYDLDACLSKILVRDNSEAIDRSALVAPNVVSIAKALEMRIEGQVPLRGKKIVGMLQSPPAAKTTTSGKPYILLNLQDESGAAIAWAWGDESVENARVALTLSKGDVVEICDARLPPKSYRSAQIWIHQIHSKIRKQA